MIWPENRPAAGCAPRPPAGYLLRTFRPGDEPAYLDLMRAAGFEDFDGEKLAGLQKRVLPGGFFVAVHRDTGALAATAMAQQGSDELHPGGGELGWVAAGLAHTGKGLGLAVCAAVVGRFLAAGCRRIYLKTDDWRLAAIKTYLKLGFVPFLLAPEMEGRWRTVCGKLDWPFEPEGWPRPGRGGV
jgi:mycothiol synthase